MKRSVLSIKQEQLRLKQGAECARALNWTIWWHIIFEHTKLFGAHSSEQAVLELKGATKLKEVNVEGRKDFAKHASKEDIALLKLETALGGIMCDVDLEEFVNTANTLLSGDSAVMDNIYSTRLSGVLGGVGLVRHTKQNVQHISATNKSLLEQADFWFEEWFLMETAVQKSSKSKKKTQAPLLTIDNLKQHNSKALEDGINSSGIEKLGQLKALERLHLSFFLLATKMDWHKLITWMGSDLMSDDFPVPQLGELPKVMNGLAKIPQYFIVLGDKGFHKTSLFYPNLNVCETPFKLSDCKSYRKSAEMISADRPKASVCSTVEGSFAQYKIVDLLRKLFLTMSSTCFHMHMSGGLQK